MNVSLNLIETKVLPGEQAYIDVLLVNGQIRTYLLKKASGTKNEYETAREEAGSHIEKFEKDFMKEIN